MTTRMTMAALLMVVYITTSLAASGHGDTKKSEDVVAAKCPDINHVGWRTCYREEVCTKCVEVEEEVLVETPRVICWCDSCGRMCRKTVIDRCIEKKTVLKPVQYTVMKKYEVPFNYSLTAYIDMPACDDASGHADDDKPCEHCTGQSGPTPGPGGGDSGMAEVKAMFTQLMAQNSEIKKGQSELGHRMTSIESRVTLIEATAAADKGEEEYNLAKGVLASAELKLKAAQAAETEAQGKHDAASKAYNEKKAAWEKETDAAKKTALKVEVDKLEVSLREANDKSNKASRDVKQANDDLAEAKSREKSAADAARQAREKAEAVRKAGH